MQFTARRIMARLGVLGVAAAALLAVGAAPAYAISDGVIAATDAGDNIGRFVGKRPDGKFTICTATLIAPDKALTAEHCLWDSKLVSDISITFGTRNLDSDPGETATAVSWERGNRDYRGTRDSIVILTLDRSIPGVEPARVARAGVSNKLYAKGAYVMAGGWGTIDSKQDISSRELRIASMEVADPISTSNSGAIRVAETGNGRPQHGDSGGPLFAYDDQGPIVVGVYTGSGTRTGDNHFYMKTSIDSLFGG